MNMPSVSATESVPLPGRRARIVAILSGILASFLLLGGVWAHAEIGRAEGELLRAEFDFRQMDNLTKQPYWDPDAFGGAGGRLVRSSQEVRPVLRQLIQTRIRTARIMRAILIVAGLLATLPTVRFVAATRRARASAERPVVS